MAITRTISFDSETDNFLTRLQDKGINISEYVCNLIKADMQKKVRK